MFEIDKGWQLIDLFTYFLASPFGFFDHIDFFRLLFLYLARLFCEAEAEAGSFEACFVS